MIAERKAKYSRKSSAYHTAKRRALKEGKSMQEALAEAKKVSWIIARLHVLKPAGFALHSNRF